MSKLDRINADPLSAKVGVEAHAKLTPWLVPTVFLKMASKVGAKLVLSRCPRWSQVGA